MASPPYQGGALSPPATTPLSLPRQRPTLALPTASASRKSSFTTPLSGHPLRQTSFPPPDSLEAQHHLAEAQRQTRFSPEDDAYSLDEFSDSEITSAISAPVDGDTVSTPGGAGKKRKRGEKRSRGRPPKNPTIRASSVSLVNGDDARSSTPGTRRGTAGAPSIAAGDGDGEEEDDDDEDEAAMGGGAGGRGGADEGFSLDPAEMDREKQRRTLFRETVPPAHQNRYDAFNKAKLRTQDIRRLVNATLSQSVPPGVTIVVGAYTKMFAGMLIESARQVQAEWMATEHTRPDDLDNPAYKRLRLTQPTEPDSEVSDEAEPDIKVEVKKEEGLADDAEAGKHADVLRGDAGSRGGDGHNHPGDTQPDDIPTSSETRDETLDDAMVQPGAWGLSKLIDEPDRGPLLPDHLREALQRFKKAHSGGSVGFTGLSLEGREVAAPRMGGRRLFK